MTDSGFWFISILSVLRSIAVDASSRAPEWLWYSFPLPLLPRVLLRNHPGSRRGRTASARWEPSWGSFDQSRPAEQAVQSGPSYIILWFWNQRDFKIKYQYIILHLIKIKIVTKYYSCLILKTRTPKEPPRGKRHVWTAQWVSPLGERRIEKK